MRISFSHLVTVLLVLVGHLCLTSGVARGASEDSGEGESERSAAEIHDYLIRIRPAIWVVKVDGGYETETSADRNLSIRIDGDLGYDETYPTFNGDVSLRWGRHDFWVTSVLFDEDAETTAQVEFEIGGEPIQVGGIVDSRVELTDINFRYGYSFFDFEEHGFRLGPTFAVSYTDLTAEVRQVTVLGIPTGTEGSFNETLPMPTIGVHGEVPYQELLFSGQVGGFWADNGDFEATGIRASIGVSWRASRYVGFFAGVKLIYADVELSGEEIDDLVLYGPSLGFELLY